MFKMCRNDQGKTSIERKCLKRRFDQLIKTIELIATENGRQHSDMNYNKHHQTPAETMTDERLTLDESHKESPFNMDRIVPSLLSSKQSLKSLPKESLSRGLEPVLQALREVDAELLLDLKASPQGPRVRKGRCVQPIYNDISPQLQGPQSGHSWVRYLHLAEVPDQYSIGIFVFAPYARIPLHDHPDMCVLSRVLYGDLQRLSLDLVRPNVVVESDDSEHSNQDMKDADSSSNDMVFDSLFGQQAPLEPDSLESLPEGSKKAYKNHIDYLEAPGVTMLYPYEGNLHEFVAGPHGAAVLDVLLPPYDTQGHRDCTFYTIHDISSAWKYRSEKEPCFIVPTGQPESFHCISGQYRDIGGDEHN